MLSLVIGFIVLCIIAGIAYWILRQIPGIPPFIPLLVWVVVALILLVWLAENFGHLGRGICP